MTEPEIDGAKAALIAWFDSQEINPQYAGVIMIKLIAEQFTRKTKDLESLTYAVNKTSNLLLIEIAGYLRK